MDSLKLWATRTSSLIDLLCQECLCRTGKESSCKRGADHGVEINTCPDEEGGWKRKEYERRDDEGEGQLGDEVGEDVIVDLVWGWLRGFGVKKEGAEVASAI